MNLEEWLERNGLGKYAGLLNEQEIDLDVLPHLTESDIERLQLPTGARRRLLLAIQALVQGSLQPATARTPKHPSPAPERRQLTVLFCDLVGSTALSRRLDPEELRAMMRTYQQACREAIERYDGQVAQFLGDGIMAYYGWPRAHEDDAERAVRAALDIVAALKRADASVALPVHVGIATGPVVVGEGRGADATEPALAVGETPNLAARLQGLADAGEIVIAPSTRALTGAVFVYEDLGDRTLKGVVEPVRAWRVAGLNPAEGRFEATRAARLSPLVGRDEELQLLLRRWEQAREGEGQVVLLCGEPGIGKSRIAQALLERIASGPHVRLRYQCSPHHTQSAFHPIIEQLQRAAGLAGEDDAPARLAKVEAVMAAAQTDDPRCVPLIAALLDIPTADKYPPLNYAPDKQKEETVLALDRQLIALSRDAPILVSVEDAHWVDPSSLEAFDHLVRLAQDHGMLVLVTFRPEFTPRWTEQGHVTLLTLNRLSSRQAAELAKRVAGSKPLPQEVLEQIAAKTDGVPLFVEELTRSLLESGLIEEQQDRFTLATPLSNLAIPTSLRDSLTARLDRLASAKEIAQIGACIGREFGYELLSMLSPKQGKELDEALDELVKSGLVFQRGNVPANYVFKHALVQDAAYESLLKSRRAQLHAQIARILEERFPAVRESQPELLAQHYTQAHLAEPAVRYWQLAGERAAARSTYREAVAHFRKGLDLLTALPASPQRSAVEVALETALAQAYIPITSWSAPEPRAAFGRAQALAEALGDAAPPGVLFGLATFHSVRGDQRAALELARKVMALAERENDAGFLVLANATLGLCLFLRGDLGEGVTHLQDSIRLYDRAIPATLRHAFAVDVKALSMHNLALTLWLLGYPDQALTVIREAVAFARSLAHPFTEVMCLDRLSVIHAFRREWDQAEEVARQTLAAATQQGSALYVAASSWWIGRTQAMGRGTESGIELIHRGFEGLEQIGAELHHTMLLGGLAETLTRFGQCDEALSALARARALAERNVAHYWDAEVSRLRGEALLARNAAAEREVESAFRGAIEIARSQKARMLELRAATSLSRLWRDKGRPGDARDLLAPAYAWFTEGHDLPDLTEAKVLLEELGWRSC